MFSATGWPRSRTRKTSPVERAVVSREKPMMLRVSDCGGLTLTVVVLLLAAGRSWQECLLPAHPVHGRHRPAQEAECKGDSPACRGEPGTPVPDGWLLVVRCKGGFVLDQNQTFSQTACADGRWVPALPTCIYNFNDDPHKCIAPPYPKHGHYKPLPVECALDSKFSQELLSPGATYLPSNCVLLYSCESGYHLLDDDVISICDQGKWNPKDIECKQSVNINGLNITRYDSLNDDAVSRQPPTGGCVLPAQSLNRRFCSFKLGCEHCTGTQCVFEPGVTVQHHVKVTCEPGYGLSDGSDRASMVCADGETWHASFPRCVKLCPPLKSDSVIITCMNGVNKADCDKSMVPGTTAKYRCRPSHSKYPGLAQDGLYDQSLRCKQDGTWHGLIYPCQPACGISKGNTTEIPTIAYGKDTKLGQFPWHAGLYRLENSTKSWKHICGGSLITKSVVLTAAHCVFREFLNILHPSELRVALAKYYRSWTHQEEFQVKCEVSRISVALGYRGPTDRYALDIALLVLTESVAINSFVMPVCIDHSLTSHVKNNTLGYVVGWGKTSEGGVNSEILLHSEVSIIDESYCRRLVPGSYFGNDKFCAVKESATESVVQPGDSGGGLTTIGVGGLHFIVGIASTKNNNFPLFTNVSWDVHQRWLEDELQQEGIRLNITRYDSLNGNAVSRQPPTGGCVLPTQSLNRRFCSFKLGCEHCTGTQCVFEPGVTVQHHVKVTCDPGYGLSDLRRASMVCEDGGSWHASFPRFLNSTKNSSPSNNAVLSQSPTGRCVIPSQSLNRRFCSFEIGCEHCTGRQCAYEPGDTVRYQLKVLCEPGYGLDDGRDLATIVCVDGRETWDAPFPSCVKVCPPLKSDSLIINCMKGVSKVNCDKPIVPGTTASYRCRPSHHRDPGGLYDHQRQAIRCKQTGEWSGPLYPCEPACGISKGNSSEIPLIFDGKDTKLGVFPWHAGLYRLENSTEYWKYICGGSLITKSVVLTAAHCVFREQVNLLHPTELRVALAKYYRSWTHQEEFQVKCEVSRISVAPGYRGPINSYIFNMAVLFLSEPVAINSFVMPVCIDHSLPLHLKNNTLGYVVGWGKSSQDASVSENLLHSDVSITDESYCQKLISRSPSYIAIDKICTVKESVAESVAQLGDSGGGLTTIGVGGLHFIVGIVSSKSNGVTLATNISWNHHQMWLKEKLILLPK